MGGLRVGLILGLMIGLGIALLMAPAPGAETRHKLRERADPAMERVLQRIRRNDREGEPVVP